MGHGDGNNGIQGLGEIGAATTNLPIDQCKNIGTHSVAMAVPADSKAAHPSPITILCTTVSPTQEMGVGPPPHRHMSV